ncbi:hypothetical protein [Heyndrickxia sporothermodurans]|uniref:hypothetical protein n=1 Tax=Heyndrickxia sporothermodurans TaxID=46224 RepID=UPI001F1A8097|nr:hypothetical protein [Heyndrickxia sporothermodurans]
MHERAGFEQEKRPKHDPSARKSQIRAEKTVQACAKCTKESDSSRKKGVSKGQVNERIAPKSSH